MHLVFWGVRGSYPVPGTATTRYGGHTSCVEVRSNSNRCLIVDAGTGLRGLGQKLAAENAEQAESNYNLILSHVHWDHIQGLPFFEPAYQGGNHITVHAPRVAADETRKVISGITRHEFFPASLEAAPAIFEYVEVMPGIGLEIEDFEIMPVGLNHPFGAVGYRINADDTSLAYISDTAPFDRMLHKQHFVAGPEEASEDDLVVLKKLRADLVSALKGVDTVIYDTHFTEEEYEKFPHWGHSTPEHALQICKEAGIRQLILFHHAPAHDDAMMDEIGAQYYVRGKKLGVVVSVAKEGLTIPIGVRRGGTNPGISA
ncbi:MAG: MBL fold metallo-hydrolase [Kofleriaceae bacterium]|nr:MBL fold metallo-hydrolase [Kofleriaceae bacterium]